RLLTARFLLLFLLLPVGLLAAPPSGSGEPLSKNAWDIAVIDQVLATVKPGQKMVPFGDVGIKPEVLQVFRQRLVDGQSGASEGGFSSSVGMAGGEQFVQFGPNSWNRGTVCHEVGHAIGLYHEQQRDDRDTYVVILTQNIIPGAEANFAKLPGGSVAKGAYDFYSVMHYVRNALSIDPDH